METSDLIMWCGVGGGQLRLPVVVAQVRRLGQKFLPLLEDGHEVLCPHPVSQIYVARHLLLLAVEISNEYNCRELS